MNASDSDSASSHVHHDEFATSAKPPKWYQVFTTGKGLFVTWLGIFLCLFTLIESNFPRLQEVSKLAIFTMVGMVLCFLIFPVAKRWEHVRWLRVFDVLLAIGTVVCCMYVVVQSEDVFQDWWLNNLRLGDRSSAETMSDQVIAICGILLVLECTRRAIGFVVPALAILFIAHSYYCYLSQQHGLPPMPGFLLPHQGISLTDIANSTFLYSSGVFGAAARVMFLYVFLFVIFGAFLEVSGATQFIIDFAEGIFGKSPGGPAKVSVLGSGLMGSLSGSAVANAMTTGAFTIPMMRNAGFDKEASGGITAAAASGGALVPPVMGAGAYMMLELVQPQVSFLQIARAALIPSALYYFSLWMIVHFYSKRIGASLKAPIKRKRRDVNVFDGAVFFAALATLVSLLLWKFTPFKAVSGSLIVILLMTTFRKSLGKQPPLSFLARVLMWIAFAVGTCSYLTWIFFIGQNDVAVIFNSLKNIVEVVIDSSLVGFVAMVLMGLVQREWRPTIRGALSKSAKGAVALVAASACVGIIIAIVDKSGIATDFSAQIKQVVASSLLLALVGIMCCSIVLGMGVPSVVCYLLMATLMGSLLSELGVIPLGAHLFIFYFGMMSMVTPPVALAAYASASIAESNIMKTSVAAFKFSLVGFTLPYMFVYRPALLLMNEGAWNKWIAENRISGPEAPALLEAANEAWPALPNMVIAILASVLGIVALAGGIAGFMQSRLNPVERILCLLSAALLLVPIIEFQGRDIGAYINVVGGLIFIVIAVINYRRGRGGSSQPQADEPPASEASLTTE